MITDSPELKNGDGRPDYLIEYDKQPLNEATRVRLEINLDLLAADYNWGTKMLRGALDEFKTELLMVINAKRQKEKEKVILAPAGLKVH